MAMTRITWRGVRLNTRTRDMVLAAERILGYQFRVIQGSYNAGGVAASAGTHDGGGAIDVWGKGNAYVSKEVAALRHVGFAAWGRTPAQGNWGYHEHCIAIGDADLSSGAAHQVTEYKQGYNGLAGSGKDTFTRAYVNMTWEKYRAQVNPVPVSYLTFHTLSVKAGANGLALSPWTKNEVEKFMSYAVQTGALTRDNRNSWLNVCALKNWAHAGLIVKQTVKNVQHKGGLVVDGICGAQTAAYINKSSIARCVFNG